MGLEDAKVWYLIIQRPDGTQQRIAFPDELVRKWAGRPAYRTAGSTSDKIDRVAVLRMAEAEVWGGP